MPLKFFLFIGVFLVYCIVVLVCSYWRSSKIEEYEKIIDDLISFMDLKSYDDFVEYANYTKNGKSRYKRYTFCKFTQKRTYKLEKKSKILEGQFKDE